MNVNGSSYHLYLGRDDWAACRTLVEGEFVSLGKIWEGAPSDDELSAPPEWNDDDANLTIAPLLETIPPTENEKRLGVDDRRGLTADRNGNIYFVADDLQSILVQSAGEALNSLYWPDDRPCEDDSGFADLVLQNDTRTFGALAVTECDYLCAIAIDGDAMCLLRFDLVGGGPPEEFHYADFAPEGTVEMAAMSGGGLILLDKQGARLIGLTSDMQLCLTETPGESESLFQPLDDDATRRDGGVLNIWQIDLSETTEPLCMAAISSHELLLLDRVSYDAARLYLIDCDSGTRTFLIDLDVGALGLALLPKEDDKDRLRFMLWGPGGNQARAVDLRKRDESWVAERSTNLIPMRRFGGRGLVASGKRLYYDSGTSSPVWIPLMVQERCRFTQSSSLVTPPLDSDIFACVWDRIRMDAVIPEGASVAIEARSFDDLSDFETDDANGWVPQPQPYLNGDNGELPRLALGASHKTKRRTEGCWDVLLQKLEGRYVQLRLTLSGDGRRSPAISAMRIWYPRFSYAERFLPAVYSEEEISADFTERFLASVEGVNSVIEAKVAAAQYLLDPRFAPPEALDWLAGWFDIALDPVWDERRRRLFIKHAVKFLGWRGTLPGLRLALRLAFDPDIDDCDFALPDRFEYKANGIRIVENFRTRRSGRKHSTNTTDKTLRPLSIITGAQWSPAEGKSGLVERWARHLGQPNATAQQRVAPFSLVAEDYETTDWASFAIKHFGFVPSLGGEERKKWRAFQRSAGVAEPLLSQPVDGDMSIGAWREFTALMSLNQQHWQRFLRGKYGQIAFLNTAWASAWTDFAQIALPDVLPETITALEDWLMFEGQVMPMQQSAHRFSVLLPRQDTGFDPEREEQEMALAKRIIELEKPAHTIFDVRFFWAMNRLGEARLGYDTQIGAGSRATQLIPPAILGRNVTGAAFVGGPQNSQSGRERLAC